MNADKWVSISDRLPKKETLVVALLGALQDRPVDASEGIPDKCVRLPSNSQLIVDSAETATEPKKRMNAMNYITMPMNLLPNGLTLLQQNPDCAARLEPCALYLSFHLSSTSIQKPVSLRGVGSTSRRPELINIANVYFFDKLYSLHFYFH